VLAREGSAEQLFAKGLAAMGLSLGQGEQDVLLQYQDILLKWNRRMNLIAKNTSPVDCIEKHFLDSLTLLPFFSCSGAGKTLLDVGTGAGFPGLVLAVALPALRVILVEPREKRVSFLRHVVRTLGLKNVEVIGERLEAVPNLCDEKISSVTSRAVVEPAGFLQMVAPYLSLGANVLLMLGRDQGRNWLKSSPLDGIVLEERREFLLPFSASERVVCQVRMPVDLPMSTLDAP